MEIEINDQFKKAIDLMEKTKKNIFITGKAGTGKSTLLTYFRNITKKNIVVLAPTGVAAVNISGETIHSFFGFKPDITIEKIKYDYEKAKEEGRDYGVSEIYKNLDAIIIDEISMVRADLLDCVDYFLKLHRKSKRPFGNLQMIFFGDLYQLSPVVKSEEKEIFKKHYETPYFFSANVFKDKNLSMEFIELEKIYRQKDEKFIKLLNAIRNNTVTDDDLEILNERVLNNKDMESDKESKKGRRAKKDNEKNDKSDICAVYLTTINKSAYEINNEKLKNLNKKIRTYTAKISGNFDMAAYPADVELKICEGAQVMLLNNDPSGRWVNGSIGKVINFGYNKKTGVDEIYVKLSDGNVVNVAPHKWEIFHFYYDKKKGSIATETLGSFRQYPIKLAWAITIHKSQGKTFDRIVVDLRRAAFAPGQIYVALSRCRTLEGISLTKAIKKKDIFMDWKIVKFLTNFQYNLSEKELPKKEKIGLIKKAIKEGKCLEITYLKTNDEKSHRTIKPYSVGKKDYLGKKFDGVEGYCFLRKENRIFRLDRILEIRVADKI